MALSGDEQVRHGYVTDVDGRLQVELGSVSTGAGQTLAYAEIDRATSGAVVAAHGTLRIYVVSYVLVVASAVTVEWRSAATGISGAMSLPANGGVSACGAPWAPLMRTAAAEALNVELGSGVQVSGHVTYFNAA